MADQLSQRIASAWSDAEALADAGLLTRRQAQAIAFRDLHNIDRKTTAEELDVSPSYVDNARAEGREKIAAAWETLHLLD